MKLQKINATLQSIPMDLHGHRKKVSFIDSIEDARCNVDKGASHIQILERAAAMVSLLQCRWPKLVILLKGLIFYRPL